MHKNSDSKKYIKHPDVSWVVDLATIKLINEQTHTIRTLKYPEAAIWDFVSRGYSIKKIIALMSTIAYINASHAATLVNDTLENLIELGFIIEKP